MNASAVRSIETVEDANKKAVHDDLISPRFYTTDFDEIAKMDISPNEDELEAILEEFRVDYNRHHFVRKTCRYYVSYSYFIP